MSPRHKPGLHARLNEIVERQTAQPPERSEESKRLISRFTEPAASPVTHDSPITHESPSVDESPITDASPITIKSPVKSAPLALPSDSPSAGESPAIRDSPKRNAGTGDSRIRHAFFDERVSGREVTAQLLYFHLNRYRDGGGELTIPVSWRRLTERIPVSESTLRRAYAVLNREGLASIERSVFGKGSAQGNIFRVVRGESPSTHERASTGDTHKRKNLKDNSKGVSVCDLCKESPGFIYPSGVVGQGPVKPCPHREGK